jgi:hypothetical protein
MKQIMLVVSVLAALTMGTMAAEEGAAGKEKGKAKHAEMTKEQREEMMNKRLESIKAKDEALYKELVDLKEKDPAAFKAKMREQAKQQGKAHGKGQGKGKGKGKGVAEQAPAAAVENK